MAHFIVQPAARPLAGKVAMPGDKSIGHRSLTFGALADGPVRVRGLGEGADNRSTARAFAALGVTMRPDGDALIVEGVGLDGLRAPAAPIDCGNSGTTMRLLCGLLAAQPFDSTLIGDDSLSRRPMMRVVEPLRRMGARIEGATAPLRIRPPRAGLRGIDYTLPIASAQVKTALLLAGLYAEGTTTVREPGPSRDHSERMLRYLGAPVASPAAGVTQLDARGWDRKLAARELDVPGDPSSAAFVIAAGVVAGAAELRVQGVCLNPTRTGFLDALAAMGAELSIEPGGEACGEPTGDLVVRAREPGALRAITIDGDLMVRCIDEVPILAVVAAAAEGVTWFRNAAELRVKESDRIATTTAMLRALGVEVEEHDKAFAVHGLGGAPFRAARIDSAGDHRIAMSAVVAGLAADGETFVDDVDNVATSFPSFAELMRALGADLRG